MFLYLDSLFAEGRARDVEPLYEIPATLNRLYQMAMREHARGAALVHRADGRWQDTPDWRLDRHVIRLGLYLQEELRVAPGERVAIVSELRPEWFVVDFAIQALGCVSVAIDPALAPDELSMALDAAGPTVVFVSGAGWTAHRAALTAHRGATRVVVFDGAALPAEAAAFSVVLDLGGTYDTPERAQPFRQAARELHAGSPTLVQCVYDGDGATAITLTQGDVIERIARHWTRHPARQGDVAYVVGPSVNLATRLAVYTMIGDGYSTVALGDASGAPAQVAELRPHKVVASPPILAEMIANGAAGPVSTLPQGWRGLASRLTPAGRERRRRAEARAPFGGRIRWIGASGVPDDALAARLSEIAAVDVEHQPAPAAQPYTTPMIAIRETGRAYHNGNEGAI